MLLLAKESVDKDETKEKGVVLGKTGPDGSAQGFLKRSRAFLGLKRPLVVLTEVPVAPLGWLGLYRSSSGGTFGEKNKKALESV